MRKFLIVSVCLFASLAANAGIKVTKCADGVTDSIAVDGSFTEADLQNMKVASKVKLATGSYELTENEWAKLCEKVIASGLYARYERDPIRFHSHKRKLLWQPHQLGKQSR